MEWPLVLIACGVVTWAVITLYERHRTHSLVDRLPDATAAYSGMEERTEVRVAVDLVRRAVAAITGISPNQVAPQHRIDVDYIVQPHFAALTLDDPADGILDQLDEYLENMGYPPLPTDQRTVVVADLIFIVSKHLKERCKAHLTSAHLSSNP